MRYFREQTAHTPLILFEKGVLQIAGRSIPEDSYALYEPLYNFIEQYGADFPHIDVQIKLEYANSSTNRSLMTLFEYMAAHITNGREAKITWFYAQDDVEMQKLGTDFMELLSIIPFEIRAVDSIV